MPKPFKKLGEILGISPNAISKKETSFPFKVLSWEEIIQLVKPLNEKNIHFEMIPKPAKFFKEEFWPPYKLEVKVDLTSEYIEGKKKGVDSQLLQALKMGKFSIQASLNIRGLSAEEAKLSLEEFFKRALQRGYSCVLIIHGRGLSSKADPVLKPLVKEWLEKGPYRRYILAFASARPCDGGLGATYVLLSSKPLKKNVS
ncbi:MAG: Smr/MutS family protein [Caldimicrobium sp.]|nr:Smr/MutS family protein [Caldimicrobium sp.]MCX7873094.1 Smr/MutS family protein [Caldimicrobium sp.]MDW8094519.1 Smr/MutS family protein [Caldimicrobium sp.]